MFEFIFDIITKAGFGMLNVFNIFGIFFEIVDEIMDTRMGRKHAKLHDKYYNRLNAIEKTRIGKLIDKIIMLAILGPIYFSWFIFKWSMRLTFKALKLLFGRKH